MGRRAAKYRYQQGWQLFAHHGFLESAASTIFRQLADEEYLAKLEAIAFSNRAAHHMAELNALHPFREGNGRTIREFISQLAHRNGFYIAWQQVNQAEMLPAVIRSFKGDNKHLAILIEDILSVDDRYEDSQQQ